MRPSKSDYLSWRDNPVTKAALEAFNQKREVVKEQLAEDAFGEDHKRYVGYAMALKDVLLYIKEDFDYIEDENA